MIYQNAVEPNRTGRVASIEISIVCRGVYKTESENFNRKNETEQAVMMTMMMAAITATMPDFLTPKLISVSRYFNTRCEFGVSVSQFGRRRFLYQSSSSRVSAVSEMSKLVAEFDPEIPLERASTPPSSWYTDPQFHRLELDRVFYGGWQAVGSEKSTHFDSAPKRC